MKRTISLVFALVFALCLCACGAAEPAPETAATTQATEATTVPTTEATEPPTEETVPEGTLPDGSLPIVKVPTENGVKFIGDGLKITVENERELTVTLSNIEVQDSYLTDRADSSDGAMEYSWEVQFHSTDDVIPFNLATSCYAFQPGRELNLPVSSMQTSLWVAYPGTNYWHVIQSLTDEGKAEYVDPTVSYTPDSITWQITIPEEYLDMEWEEIDALKDSGATEGWITAEFPFDYEGFLRFQVEIRNFPEELFENRIYTVQ